MIDAFTITTKLPTVKRHNIYKVDTETMRKLYWLTGAAATEPTPKHCLDSIRVDADPDNDELIDLVGTDGNRLHRWKRAPLLPFGLGTFLIVKRTKSELILCKDDTAKFPKWRKVIPDGPTLEVGEFGYCKRQIIYPCPSPVSCASRILGHHAVHVWQHQGEIGCVHMPFLVDLFAPFPSVSWVLRVSPKEGAPLQLRARFGIMGKDDGMTALIMPMQPQTGGNADDVNAYNDNPEATP